MILGLDHPQIGILGIVVMLAGLFIFRMPAGFVMAIVGYLGLALFTSPSAALNLARSEFWGMFSKYGLTVIPMFILLGEFIYHAGYSDRLYHTTYTWFGHWRGGLAISTVVASGGFSAICGSNTATAATMASVSIPSMRRYHYHPTLSSGAVAAGSTLGVMVPPSIVLVVYGLHTGESIGQLFFGALIPSAILLALIVGTVFLICRRHPDWGPKGPPTGWREKLRSLPDVLDIAILFVLIMAAFFSGKITATEAASVSSVLGLIICLVRRKMSWRKFRAAIYDTLRISCMVFMIIAGATIFGKFMTLSRLPFQIAAAIGELDWPNWTVLALMLLCYVVGGCVMDALAFLLISLPIFLPVAESMGYDPVWFGEIVCLVTTLGAITPPIGICCYVISGMAKDIPVTQVFKGSLYYVPAYIVAAVLVVLFPEQTVMWLADLVK